MATRPPVRTRLLLPALPLLAALLAACGAHVYHVVKKDETLYSISFRYGQDFRDVARWNGIAPPYTISEGQPLRIIAPPRGGASAASAVMPQTVTKQPAPESVARVIPLRPAAEQDKVAEVTAQPGAVAWQWPAQGAYTRVAATKSARNGLDIAGIRGDAVRAAADGRVVYSGTGIPHYGNLLIIKHNERFLSAYAHNQRLLVGEGEQVAAGQTVAEMGDSGSGTNVVKLHFEIRQDGVPVDPLEYLPRRQTSPD